MSDISEAYNDRCHAAMTRYAGVVNAAFATMNAAFAEQEAELSAAQKEFHDRTAERLRQFNGEPAQEQSPPPPAPPAPPAPRMPPAPDLSEIERNIIARRAGPIGPITVRAGYDPEFAAFSAVTAALGATDDT